MKSYKDRLRKVQLGQNLSNFNIDNILEIKSVYNTNLKDIPKHNETVQSYTEPTQISPVKYNSYVKNLEEENKKLQYEIFSVKEENSYLSRQNKELQIKNSSQQSYITRLNVEISKLQRNLYQAGNSDSNHKIKIKSFSKRLIRPRRLNRSSSNSHMDRKDNFGNITCLGIRSGFKE
jgi:predicted RNase H-like nuclease (RuvC/YqgF family)